MTDQAARADTVLRAGGDARGVTVPEVTVRVAGAMLALAVAAVHVADQGGVTAFTSPGWIGWGYRLIEAGGVATALVLLLPRPAWLGPAWAGWAAGVLLGVGPFVAYIASRTVGVPGDPGDVGNWGYWVGTVSLLVEASLMALSVSMLPVLRRPAVRGALANITGRAGRGR
jgi:hypothetical protein